MIAIAQEQIEKLNDLKGSLVYVNKILQKPIDNWKRKEYDKIKVDYEEQIRQLTFHINSHPEIFGKEV